MRDRYFQTGYKACQPLEREQSWLSIVLTAALVAMLPGNPASGIPPSTHAAPPARPDHVRRDSFQARVQQQGGNFFYFVAALLTLGGVGAGLRTLAPYLRTLRPKQRAVRWSGVVGADIAAAAAAAFYAVAGSPNEKPSGIIWLGAVFVVSGFQFARQFVNERATSDDVNKSS
jgi:hypothetical protein